LKSPAAYYLLLIYLFALCKPVMPLLQDAIAHTFFEHQHLVTVHKDGGSTHVMKEVGNLAHSDTPINSDTLKLYDDVPLHLAVSLQLDLHLSHQLLVHSSHSPDYFFPVVSLAIQLLPPRA
jgi:hypothetical protein